MKPKSLSNFAGSYADESAMKQNGEVKRLRHELAQFGAENAALRTSVLALTSEVYGARLAAKYLDKVCVNCEKKSRGK